MELLTVVLFVYLLKGLIYTLSKAKGGSHTFHIAEKVTPVEMIHTFSKRKVDRIPPSILREQPPISSPPLRSSTLPYP